MPNKQASIKDLRKSTKRAKHNLRIKTHVKHLVKKSAEVVAEEKFTEAKELIRIMQQAVDKAAKRGVIDKNKASRKKSQLMKKLNAIKK